MKVLLLNSTYEFGSTGRICSELTAFLRENGHQAVCLYGRGVSSDECAYKVGTKLELYEHVIQTRIFDRHGLASRQATSQTINYIDGYKPDLLHIHNLHGYYINYPMLFSYIKKKNIPVVWTLHDCWAFTGHCAYYSTYQCNKWKDACFECPQKKEYPTSLLFDRSAANYCEKEKAFLGLKKMILATPAKWLSEEVKQSFLGGYNVRTVYNGIDLSIFKPTPSDIKSRIGIKGKMILGVANIWAKHKGLADFIELANYIDSKWTIVLVGLSSEQAKGLPSNIIAIERTNSLEELTELYSAADVFVNPSRQETFGMVTLEAIACGTPVITYNLTAVPEVVGPNCGYVVDPNPRNIYKKLELLQDKQDACLSWAREFDKNQNHLHYLDLYSQITNQ